MKTVWKYQTIIGQVTRVPQLPPGSRVVHVAPGENSETLQFWIERGIDGDIMNRQHRPANFYVFGTGHNIPDHFLHVGTAIMEPFVWHLYAEYL